VLTGYLGCIVLFLLISFVAALLVDLQFFDWKIRQLATIGFGNTIGHNNQCIGAMDKNFHLLRSQLNAIAKRIEENQNIELKDLSVIKQSQEDLLKTIGQLKRDTAPLALIPTSVTAIATRLRWYQFLKIYFLEVLLPLLFSSFSVWLGWEEIRLFVNKVLTAI